MEEGNEEDEVIEGIPPKEEDVFWKRAMREMAKRSIDSIDSSAKNLVVAITVLVGLYFNALPFDDLKEKFFTSSFDLAIASIIVLPIALWLISLLCAIFVLFTKSYEVNVDVLGEPKRVFYDIAKRKYRWLKAGLILLIISFLLIIMNIYIYLRVI